MKKSENGEMNQHLWGGAVAQWVERATLCEEVVCLIPVAAPYWLVWFQYDVTD